MGHTVDGHGLSRVLYKSMKAMKRSTLLYATLFGVCPSNWMTKVFQEPLTHGVTGVVSIQAIGKGGLFGASVNANTAPPVFVVHNYNGAYYFAVFMEGGRLEPPRFLCHA